MKAPQRIERERADDQVRDIAGVVVQHVVLDHVGRDARESLAPTERDDRRGKCTLHVVGEIDVDTAGRTFRHRDR
jgi:hypothetical protein